MSLSDSSAVGGGIVSTTPCRPEVGSCLNLIAEAMSTVRLGGYRRDLAPNLLKFERNKRSIPVPLAVNPRWLQSDEGFHLLELPLYTVH